MSHVFTCACAGLQVELCRVFANRQLKVDTGCALNGFKSVSLYRFIHCLQLSTCTAAGVVAVLWSACPCALHVSVWIVRHRSFCK